MCQKWSYFRILGLLNFRNLRTTAYLTYCLTMCKGSRVSCTIQSVFYTGASVLNWMGVGGHNQRVFSIWREVAPFWREYMENYSNRVSQNAAVRMLHEELLYHCQQIQGLTPADNAFFKNMQSIHIFWHLVHWWSRIYTRRHCQHNTHVWADENPPAVISIFY